MEFIETYTDDKSVHVQCVHCIGRRVKPSKCPDSIYTACHSNNGLTRKVFWSHLRNRSKSRTVVVAVDEDHGAHPARATIKTQQITTVNFDLIFRYVFHHKILIICAETFMRPLTEKPWFRARAVVSSTCIIDRYNYWKSSFCHFVIRSGKLVEARQSVPNRCEHIFRRTEQISVCE